MARYLGPRMRLCRREAQDLFLHSAARTYESKCKHKVIPGFSGQRNTKMSYFAIQFREKQKIKRLYGVLEVHLFNYFSKALKIKGNTGLNLLNLLESRLDNVVYRMGFARTRAEARQMVVHKHVLVNGSVTDRPSYAVLPNDVISLVPKVKKLERVQQSLALALQLPLPAWLNVIANDFSGVFLRYPDREEHYQGLNESFVVELYSK